MAPFGLKLWENAFQTIPHITFVDAEQFFLDVYLGFVCGLKNLRNIGKQPFWRSYDVFDVVGICASKNDPR